ncbi:hypothetical protein [Amnibacterium sp.]|uniref:hypothetical protein n=1 Tax=Amnibacterium sp. TaxID=1872496 RepID=UPI003F7C9431
MHLQQQAGIARAGGRAGRVIVGVVALISGPTTRRATTASSVASGTRIGSRRVAALVLAVGIAIAGVGVSAFDVQPAQAAPSSPALTGFDPANIIDDAVMFNGGAMTADQIQTFLNTQQPSCAPGATCLKSVTVDMPAVPANPMCAAMPGQANATAAQVIAAVAVACAVNPEVILVTLQKEQTLITGRTPSAGETVSLIYRKATGLGCPDTAACDPTKYGLFNQLYGLAYWLVRYTTPPGTTGPGWTQFNWFPVGKPSAVLYNPDPTCGTEAVTIQNKATAALYYYTPYVPNTAALSAGWGLGDSCSAYGNRNFYLYFTSWFGSTHSVATGPAVTGAIAAAWSQSGGQQGPLGNPTGAAASATGQGVTGQTQAFQNGTIYASSAGAWPVTGPLLAAYAHLGGQAGALGWPTTNAYTDQNGSVQRFQQGALYVDSSGSFTLDGALLSAYLNAGGPTGRLGWPTGAPSTSQGRITGRFAHGTLTAVSLPGFGAWPATGSVPSALAQGQTLSPGKGLLSPDGRFLLTQQPDGNLVLYDNTGRALWASHRSARGSQTVMQPDGNLVQYTSAHRAVWATGTNRSGAASAVMQSDGNFVLYTRARRAVWATGTRGLAARFTPMTVRAVSVPGFASWPAIGSRTGTLTEPNTLSSGQGLLSPDGRFLLTQQADGNLVLYTSAGRALWSSHRFGQGYRTVMQADGNLVQYTPAHRAVWATGTNRTGAASAVMQSDGNFVLYTGAGKAVWDTNTRG